MSQRKRGEDFRLADVARRGNRGQARAAVMKEKRLKKAQGREQGNAQQAT
jgi:hypothetical protein